MNNKQRNRFPKYVETKDPSEDFSPGANSTLQKELNNHRRNSFMKYFPKRTLEFCEFILDFFPEKNLDEKQTRMKKSIYFEELSKLLKSATTDLSEQHRLYNKQQKEKRKTKKSNSFNYNQRLSRASIDLHFEINKLVKIGGKERRIFQIVKRFSQNFPISESLFLLPRLEYPQGKILTCARIGSLVHLLCTFKRGNYEKLLNFLVKECKMKYDLEKDAYFKVPPLFYAVYFGNKKTILTLTRLGARIFKSYVEFQFLWNEKLPHDQEEVPTTSFFWSSAKWALLLGRREIFKFVVQKFREKIDENVFPELLEQIICDGDVETLKFLVGETKFDLKNIVVYDSEKCLRYPENCPSSALSTHYHNPDIDCDEAVYRYYVSHAVICLAAKKCVTIGLEMNKYLVEEIGLSRDRIEYGENNPLYYAIISVADFPFKIEEEEYLEILRLYATPKNRNVLYQYETQSIISIACMAKNLMAVRFLVEELKINVCQIDVYGVTPLIKAAQSGSKHVCRYLAQHMNKTQREIRSFRLKDSQGKDIDRKGQTFITKCVICEWKRKAGSLKPTSRSFVCVHCSNTGWKREKDGELPRNAAEWAVFSLHRKCVYVLINEPFKLTVRKKFIISSLEVDIRSLFKGKTMHVCGGCELVGYNYPRCSSCKSQWYCSVNCQKSHWKKEHRKFCKKVD